MNNAEMDVTWDSAKAQSNIAKHGVTFAQAATVLFDPLALTVLDEMHSQNEERWFTLGMSSKGTLLAVAHTYQATASASVQVRIISAREKRLVTRENNMKTGNMDDAMEIKQMPDSDIPAEIDFSKGVRGKFHRPGARLHLPVYLDDQVQIHLAALANRKGVDFSVLVNDLLRKDLELIEMAQ